MMQTLLIPEVWAAAGLPVRTMDGWTEPAKKNYFWRLGDPEASMWHHTATTAYTPNRDKANVWAGLERDGRLYQSGGGEPMLVVANAYPAPISSGNGQLAVLEKARRDERNDEAARGGDDVPDWAGNRSYWNTEIVCDGVGGRVADAVWELVTLSAALLHELFGWSRWRALGHAQHTSRKIDYRDGRYPNMAETMIAFRNDMEVQHGMELSRWASRLREIDIQQYAGIGVLTAAEVDYWAGKVRAAQADESLWNDSEWQDLRDAAKVRGPIHGYPGQI